MTVNFIFKDLQNKRIRNRPLKFNYFTFSIVTVDGHEAFNVHICEYNVVCF